MSNIFFDQLKKERRVLYFGIILFAVLSVFSTISILRVIGEAISLPDLWRHDLLPKFAFMLLLYIVSATLLQRFTVRLSNRICERIEVETIHELRNVSSEVFESIGKERIFVALSDIRSLNEVPVIAIGIFQSVVIVLCCFVYLLATSLEGASLLIIFLIILFVINFASLKRFFGVLELLGESNRKGLMYIEDLVFGNKELRSNSVLSNRFFDVYLSKNIAERYQLTLRGSMQSGENDLLSRSSWLLATGFCIFLLPRYDLIGEEHLGVFLFILLFLVGPISMLASIPPFYIRTKVSISRLHGFLDLLRVTDHVHLDADKDSNLSLLGFREIRFVNGCFEHFAGQNGFKVGPLNLTLKQGELVFITGGNGAGKSTFLKLLTGLYRLREGGLFYNECCITEATIESYRNKFSIIYSPAYLFSGFYREQAGSEYFARMQRLLQNFNIDREFDINEYRLSHISMSQGQRKRLALVESLMEDREILVFDEWAAEQDSDFRDFFYFNILPELKAAGKTVIMATHDDRFFSLADRILKFDVGRIVS